MQKEAVTDWIKLDFEQARAKHLLFKTRLRSILYGVDLDETPVVSHRDCTVGKWIYEHALSAYAYVPEMNQLEEVHKNLHTVAQKLVGLYKDGLIEESRKGLNHVESIADELITLFSIVESKVQQSDTTVINNKETSEISLIELQELQKLNKDLDKRIREQSKNLFDAKERFELVAKATQDAIWDWNLETNSIWWNEGFSELFGYKPEEIEPTIDSWYNRVHADDRERVVGGIHAVIDNGGKKWSGEYRFRRRDGSYALVFDRGYALHDAQGKPTRMLGSMQDVTEQRKAQEALRVSEERLKKVLSIETVGVIYFDLDGRIHDANTAFERMSGFAKEFFANGKVRLDEITPPEFMEVTLKSRDEFLTKWQNTPYEKQYIHPDGSRWWGLCAGKRLSEHECVEFVLDISGIKRLENELEIKVTERTSELENAIQELKHSNANLQEFAYAASHDLKEPVRKIHFFADRIKQTLLDRMTPVERHFFERMENAAKRMGSLIDDLLFYSEVSLQPPVFETVNLNEIINLVLKDLDLEIEENKATIKVDNLFSLKGNHRQLQQVFQNLLSNSIKYAKPGETPSIHITCNTCVGHDIHGKYRNEDEEREFYVVSISDNGIGFEQKDAERIFNVFTRLHGNTEFKGTGVGLSIVRKIIENHNGYIIANSELLNGAVFKIYLPQEDSR